MKKLNISKITLALEILIMIMIVANCSIAIVLNSVSLKDYLVLGLLALLLIASAMFSTLGQIVEDAKKG